MGEDRKDPVNEDPRTSAAGALGTDDQHETPVVNPQASAEDPQGPLASGNDPAEAAAAGPEGGAARAGGSPQSPDSRTTVEPSMETPVEDLAARERGGMMGGATLPNNAQELAEDEVEESSMESFPASDAPAW